MFMQIIFWKSIFVFLGQGVTTSPSELPTSRSPQPSFNPPAYQYNISHTLHSPSIAFGNRNASISPSFPAILIMQVNFDIFSTKNSYSSLRGFIGLKEVKEKSIYFTSVPQTSYHLTNKPCGALILPVFSLQCSILCIFKASYSYMESRNFEVTH